MANQYRAYYSTSLAGSYTLLNNLVEFGINVGRKSQLDQYNASTATLTLRYPTGFASPISDLVAGTFIKITGSGGSPVHFTGVISNVRVKYGMPYSGGVGNDDYLYIECESWFARFARMAGNNYVMPAGTLVDQTANAQTQTGVSITSTSVGNTMASTTISSTWGDWVNRSIMSVNGRLLDAAENGQLILMSPYDLYQSSVTFTDAGSGSNIQKYNQIEFNALADNYYTQVIVAPESYSAATVTKAGASIPYRTYQTNTFNSSTSQATDLANFLLSNYGTSKFAISSISASERAQGTPMLLDDVGVRYGQSGIYACIGAQVNVVFRGTTFTCVVEGCSVYGNPSDTNYTFFLSGADLNAYLILNNAVFGTLDFNKLGY